MSNKRRLTDPTPPPILKKIKNPLEVSQQLMKDIRELPLHDQPDLVVPVAPVGKRVHRAKKFTPSMTRPVEYIQPGCVSTITEWISDRRNLVSNCEKLLICVGPTGTGKTTCLEQLASEYGAELLVFDCSGEAANSTSTKTQKNQLLLIIQESLDSLIRYRNVKPWIILDGIDRLPLSWIESLKSMLIQKYQQRLSTPLLFAIADEMYGKSRINAELVKSRLAKAVVFKPVSTSICGRILSYWKKAGKTNDDDNEDDEDEGSTLKKTDLHVLCKGDVRQLKNMWKVEKDMKKLRKLNNYTVDQTQMSPFLAAAILRSPSTRLDKQIAVINSCSDKPLLFAMIREHYIKVPPPPGGTKGVLSQLDYLAAKSDSLSAWDTMGPEYNQEDHIEDYVHAHLVTKSSNIAKAGLKWSFPTFPTSHRNVLDGFSREWHLHRSILVELIPMCKGKAITAVELKRKRKKKVGSQNTEVSFKERRNATYETLLAKLAECLPSKKVKRN